jgi:hypothetical protein
MKKLLLLTNFVCICALFASCQNKQKATEQTVIENKENAITVESAQIRTDTIKTGDTTKVKKESTASSGTVGTGPGIKKDSAKKITQPTAIIHSAPDQEKIDSIKNAKQKGKK